MKGKTIEIVSLHDYEKIIKNYDTNKVFFMEKFIKKLYIKKVGKSKYIYSKCMIFLIIP